MCSLTSKGIQFCRPSCFLWESGTRYCNEPVIRWFPTEFLDAYQTIFPLEKGWKDRLPIYQLYYLLAHLNMFGESYGSQADQLLENFKRRAFLAKIYQKHEVSYYECDINQTMTFPSMLE